MRALPDLGSCCHATASGVVASTVITRHPPARSTAAAAAVSATPASAAPLPAGPSGGEQGAVPAGRGSRARNTTCCLPQAGQWRPSGRRSCGRSEHRCRLRCRLPARQGCRSRSSARSGLPALSADLPVCPFSAPVRCELAEACSASVPLRGSWPAASAGLGLPGWAAQVDTASRSAMPCRPCRRDVAISLAASTESRPAISTSSPPSIVLSAAVVLAKS